MTFFWLYRQWLYRQWLFAYPNDPGVCVRWTSCWEGAFFCTKTGLLIGCLPGSSQYLTWLIFFRNKLDFLLRLSIAFTQPTFSMNSTCRLYPYAPHTLAESVWYYPDQPQIQSLNVFGAFATPKQIRQVHFITIIQWILFRTLCLTYFKVEFRWNQYRILNFDLFGVAFLIGSFPAQDFPRATLPASLPLPPSDSSSPPVGWWWTHKTSRYLRDRSTNFGPGSTAPWWW